MKIPEIKILAVDDIESNRIALQYLINEYIENVVLYLASSGEEALKITYKEDIDIIMLDIQMPGLDGFDTAKYLKSNPKTKAIPIIFLTAAFKKEEFQQKGFELGAIDYLTKPIEDLQLINKLKLYIEVIIKNKQLNAINEDLHATLQKEIALKKDIEKQQLELVQQSKMAALGEMIGNIAHQWRQPLSIITVSSSSMQLNLELGLDKKEDMIQSLQNITQTAEKLSKVIDTFADYTHKENLLSFDLSTLIRDCIKNKEYIFSDDLTIIFDLEENITIKNFPNSLCQVIINILQNGKDILSNKTYKKYIFIQSKKQSDQSVVLTIKDNGGGVAIENLNKIFEPYFTTKHKAYGVGLGLNVVYRIVHESLNGKIKVSNKKFIYEDEEYEGAQFTIHLPLTLPD